MIGMDMFGQLSGNLGHANLGNSNDGHQIDIRIFTLVTTISAAISSTSIGNQARKEIVSLSRSFID